MQAAAAAARRRQLASAERHLRSAAQLLGCCRCLPVQAAAVLTNLARVLRLQAALQLPGTPTAARATASKGYQQEAKAACSSSSGSHGHVAAAVNIQQHRLREAAFLLGKGIHILVVDGGSNPLLVRSALLELAAVWTEASRQDGLNSNTAAAAAAAAAKVAAVLRAASVSAAHVRKLFLESHSLQPVQAPSSSLPEWLLETLKGHEQLQASIQQAAGARAAAVAAGGSKTAASSTTTTQQLSPRSQGGGAGVTSASPQSSSVQVISDAVLGRLAMCFYVQQLTAMASASAGLQQQQRAAEQVLLLQPVLRASCSSFAAGCCWPAVPDEVAAALSHTPLPPTSLPSGGHESAKGPCCSTASKVHGSNRHHLSMNDSQAVALMRVQAPSLPCRPLPCAGSVLVQWYRQDGCWQAPSSWCCHGALPAAGQLGAGALSCLPKQHPHISCLYVVMMPPAMAAAAGECQTGAGQDGASHNQPLVLLGELVLSLERAKRVQLQVRSLLQIKLHTQTESSSLPH